jgi:hypothetical protein
VRVRPDGFLTSVAFAEGWTIAERVRAKELLAELEEAGVQELREVESGVVQAYAPGYPVLLSEAGPDAGKPTLLGLEGLVARLSSS